MGLLSHGKPLVHQAADEVRSGIACARETKQEAPGDLDVGLVLPDRGEDAGNGPKNAVGRTFTLELPDGSTGKVVVQSLKSGKGGVVLALMGEDAPPF